MLPIAQLAFSGLMAAIDLFNKIRARARQAAELTPEQEAEWDAQIKARMNQAHWQPETRNSEPETRNPD